MRICIVKTTGKLVDSQSKATEGTLIANALTTGHGYMASDLEEKTVTDAEFQALKAQTRDAELTYVDRRVLAYPPVGDQLDDLYANGGNFSVAMQAKLKAVKDQFPKP